MIMQATQGSPLLAMWATHDTTILVFLAALGVWDGQWPPYTDTVVLEVYKESNSTSLSNESYFRFLHHGVPVVFPWCETQEKEIRSDLIPGLCNVKAFLPPWITPYRNMQRLRDACARTAPAGLDAEFLHEDHMASQSDGFVESWWSRNSFVMYALYALSCGVFMFLGYCWRELRELNRWNSQFCSAQLETLLSSWRDQKRTTDSWGEQCLDINRLISAGGYLPQFKLQVVFRNSNFKYWTSVAWSFSPKDSRAFAISRHPDHHDTHVMIIGWFCPDPVPWPNCWTCSMSHGPEEALDKGWTAAVGAEPALHRRTADMVDDVVVSANPLALLWSSKPFEWSNKGSHSTPFTYFHLIITNNSANFNAPFVTTGRLQLRGVVLGHFHAEWQVLRQLSTSAGGSRAPLLSETWHDEIVKDNQTADAKAKNDT